MKESEKTKIMNDMLSSLADKMIKAAIEGRGKDDDFLVECYEEALRIRKLSAEFGRPLPEVPVPACLSKNN